MPFETESSESNGINEIHSWDDENRKPRKLVFRIKRDNEIVEWIPYDEDFPIRPVIFEGFRRVPSELSESGYIKGALQYHLKRKIEERGIDELTVSKHSEASIRKIRNAGYRVVIPYQRFSDIATRLRGITTEAQTDRRIVVDAALHDLFPHRFDASEAGLRHRLTRLLNYLDEAVIGQMSADEIDRVLDFTKSILDKRYTRSDKRRQLFVAAKLRVDSATLAEVIDQFEANLQDRISESAWGVFLRKNLFLIESRYVDIVEQLNVVLGGTRFVDFGLADAAGYLDLFEIKLPSTRLLATQQDRGNHYWHTDTVKAIVQAEKYFENASRNAAALVEGLNRQRNFPVRVVRPRAVILIGMSDQLDNDEKCDDFRVLRTSLKNVEIILYDELLDRLKNQQGKLYV